MTDRSELLEFWKRLPADHFVHPEDKPVLDAHKHHLKLDHLPGPWWGSLLSARAFMLFLNPGFNEGTDLESNGDAVMASLRRRRLYGEDVEHQVLERHRQCRSPFEGWFEKKFRGVCTANAIEHDLCILNLVAYKSHVFRDPKLIAELPSSRLMRQLVNDEIAPRARAGELMLIVVRQARRWGFKVSEQSDTLRVLNPRSEARGAFITANTEHGRLLWHFLTRLPQQVG